jgi:hypothetical protein
VADRTNGPYAGVHRLTALWLGGIGFAWAMSAGWMGQGTVDYGRDDRGAIRFLTFHDGYHLGQLGFPREMAGGTRTR